jgi:uncharacterized cupin superfamily protein
VSDDVASAKLQANPEERFNRLRGQLGVGSFGLNQIVLAPGQRNRIHRHTRQEEVYLVLEGTLTLLVEGEPHQFVQGELVRVAPSVRRQLVNRHRQPLSLLAVGGSADHEHAGRDAEAFVAWSDAEPGTPQTVPLPDDLADAELT